MGRIARRARLLLVLVLALAFVAGCGGGDDEAASGGDTTDDDRDGRDECADVEAPEPREPGTSEAPTAELDTSKTYTLTFDTSCGSFTVTLDPELAPKTTASLVALAETTATSTTRSSTASFPAS